MNFWGEGFPNSWGRAVNCNRWRREENKAEKGMENRFSIYEKRVKIGGKKQ